MYNLTRRKSLSGFTAMLSVAALCVCVSVSPAYPIPTFIRDIPQTPMSSVSIIDNGKAAGNLVLKNVTVSEALGFCDITLSEYDTVNHALDKPVYDGMTIDVTRVRIEMKAVERTLPHETAYSNTNALPSGRSVVTVAGADGMCIDNYVVIYRNDIMTETVFAYTNVVRNPVTEHIELGSSELQYESIPASSVGGFFKLPDGTSVPYRYYLDVIATAYTTEEQTYKLTFSETVARVGEIAVDPEIIPLGSKVYITSVTAGDDWVYGFAAAEDTGSSIIGYKIDLFYDTVAECVNFGRRRARVYILE